MIVDNTVLARISAKWDKRGMFKTRWANLVAQWCVDFHLRYDKAPKANIEPLYESWADGATDKNEIKLVEKFLAGLEDEYDGLAEDSNSDYITDIAGSYFNQVRIENLLERTEGHLQSGRVSEANQCVNDFHQIELGVGEGINLLDDRKAINEAFESKRKPLVKYPGALGKFFDSALERDAFIAFMAPEKRGKSFWLLDVAYRAVLQNRKVAYFEAGDNSQHQVTRRLMARVSKTPIKRSLVNYPLTIDRDEDDKIATVNFKRKRFRKGLDKNTAWKACQKLKKSKLKTKQSLLKLSCHANSTLSVRSIRNILRNWEREGWSPDVIVIDYADILNMDSSVFEGRDRINETWKQLRSLSQTLHCLVLTATQADAASYKATVIDRSHFSEDKRKLSHVTGIVGINASPEEKEQGIMRLNWVVLRESEFSEGDCVHVATCLSLSNPSVKSCF